MNNNIYYIHVENFYNKKVHDIFNLYIKNYKPLNIDSNNFTLSFHKYFKFSFNIVL